MSAFNLEILSIWDYYDAPIRGEARVGDTLLYYVWSDDELVKREDRTYKRRIYTAYVLDDSAWELLRKHHLQHEENMEHDEDPVLSPEEHEARERAAASIRALHDALETSPGFLSFTSSSPAFAGQCQI